MKIKKLFILIFTFVIMLIMFSSLSFASSDIVVALDPGHGGDDPGAMGGNLRESDLTWKIASRVKEILDQTPGITGVLTKSQYETVNEREERARRAVENNADLLVSFHINSNDSSNSLSGAEVYVTGYTAEKRFYEYSNRLGLDILSNLRSVGVTSHSPKPIVRTGADWDRYPDGSVADYYGIISWPVHMGIPGMIIEHAFINNPYDRANYLNDTMLNRMAEADAQAIIKNKELFRREFYGKINTQLVSINYLEASENRDYIQGYIDIAEWVNNECRTPSQTPQLTLKSTDGKISKSLYVSYQDGIRYYFDGDIGSLDINKEYYLEAKLTDSRNLESEANKTQRAILPDRILKDDLKGRTFKTINNKLVFSEGPYEGKIDTKLDEIKLVENASGDTYISGYVDINEILETETRNPRSMPEIWIKSTDGTVSEKAYISYQENSNYYFDKNIENYDRTKTYYIEAVLTSEDNIASEENKKQTVQLGNGEIGQLNGITVTAQNNQFAITYYGTINTELYEMNVIQNTAGNNYISGKINIAEWVDGVCKTPTMLPTMTLKSTDGEYSEKMYVSYQNGIEYYFDKNIQKLDDGKEYYIEVALTNTANTAAKEEKTQVAKFSIDTVKGNLTDGRKVQIVNKNYLKIIDESLYYGTINTQLYEMNVIQNAAGDNYINGRIYIAEWVNGECRTPSTTPKMYLKSTDGTVNLSMYVSHQNGIEYYFDKDIEGLDTNKEYYIEAELTNPKNQAEKENQQQRVNMTVQGEIGLCTNGSKVIVEKNTIKLSDGSLYYGTINTQLYEMNTIQNAAGDNYISGRIYIAEWVNGECRTPSTTPNMYLKSTDGAVNLSMYVSYQNGIEYYFDKNIEGLDTSKEYYIEVELTNPKNQASEGEKKQTAKITPQGEIGQCTNENKVIVENNIIKLVNEDAYYGTINTELYEMNIIQNAAGDNYISGRIYIAEWVNGECRTPSATPKMYLKSTDGIVNLSMYVSYQNGIEYYFDKDIEGLDISKEYYIEVELTNPNNQAPEGEKKQTAKITQQGEIGLCTNGNRIIVEENNITINKNEPVVQDIQIEKERVKENEDSQGVTETTEPEIQQDEKEEKNYFKTEEEKDNVIRESEENKEETLNEEELFNENVLNNKEQIQKENIAK